MLPFSDSYHRFCLELINLSHSLVNTHLLQLYILRCEIIALIFWYALKLIKT